MTLESTRTGIELPYSSSEYLSKISENSQLLSYFELLKEENQKINLVSRETIESSLPQLCLESIIPFEKIEKTIFDCYLDIGSGGGFPSIPIIMTNDIKSSCLVERTGKKAKALKHFAQSLNLNITVINETLEDIKTDKKYDLISMRLVKLNSKILKIIRKLMSKDGIFVYYSEPQFKVHPQMSYKSYLLCDTDNKEKSQVNPSKSFTIFKNS